MIPNFTCKQISKKSKKFYNELCQDQMSFKKKLSFRNATFVCIDTVVIQLTTRFVDFDVISNNKIRTSTKKLADKYNLAKPAIQKQLF